MSDIDLFLPIMWAVIFIILFVVEISTINLVSIWYSLSALVTAILALFTENIVIQVLCFLLLGTILLIFTKPVAQNLLKNNNRRSDLLDEKAKVISVIDESQFFYNVIADSKNFRAYADSNLDLDTYATVYKIKGNILYIRKEDSNE